MEFGGFLTHFYTRRAQVLIIYLATELNDVSANTAMYKNVSYTEGSQPIASTAQAIYRKVGYFSNIPFVLNVYILGGITSPTGDIPRPHRGKRGKIATDPNLVNACPPASKFWARGVCRGGPISTELRLSSRDSRQDFDFAPHKVRTYVDGQSR